MSNFVLLPGACHGGWWHDPPGRCAPAGRPPVVLVGHSHTGSVISGAADRVPALVRALVCLDAFVPEDGDSWPGHTRSPPWSSARR